MSKFKLNETITGYSYKALPENWDEMLPSDQGRFCGKCEKHIVDLTTKSDAEIVSFFQHKNEDVCGKFLASQLYRDLSIPTKPSNSQWLVPFVVSLAVFSPSKASELKLVKQFERNFLTKLNPIVKIENRNIDTIRGKVVDENDMPLPDVAVTLKGYKNVLATTNISGQFQINVSEAERLKYYVFAASGYQTKKEKLHYGITIKLSKEIKENPTIILGGVNTISNENSPLYVLSFGKDRYFIEQAYFKKLDPKWIKTVSIVKNAAEIASYGPIAAGSLILLEIKDKYRKEKNLSSMEKLQ